MAPNTPPGPDGAPWRQFRTAAESAGLNLLRPVSSEALVGPTATQLDRWYPGYGHALLLGSGGPTFWERCRAAGFLDRKNLPDPLDAYTETVVDGLVALLRAADPGAVAAYPFRHARQVLPFQALTASLTDLAGMPFGIAVDRVYGPWFAWRAVVLTRLPLEPAAASMPQPSVCRDCPAPCVSACPPGATHKAGLDWQRCVDFRLAEPTCRGTCLAREACPVGTAHRYSPAQVAFHHRASWQTISGARDKD